MAADPTDLTDIDAVLKDLYVGQKVIDLTFKKNPIYATIKKFEKMVGRKYPLPNMYALTGGRSATFTNAQNNIKPPKYESFDMTRVKNYSLARVDGETVAATKDNDGAFLSELTKEIDISMRKLARDLEIKIPRSRTGSRAKVASVSTNTVTLTMASDSANLELGDTIQASTTDGGGTVRTGTGVVTAVNRDTGTFTCGGGLPASTAAGDFIYVDGDIAKGLAGFEGWIPAVVPTSGDSWYGVDRSVDTRLAGHRYDASGMLIKDGLIGAQALASREDAECDVAWINQAGWAALVKELGSKVEYCTLTAQKAGESYAKIGFRGVVVHGDYGDLKVMPSNVIPQDVAWVMTWDTWTLGSIDEAVKLEDKDGNRYLRVADDDAIEARVRFYGNCMCEAPGANVRMTLPSNVTL